MGMTLRLLRKITAGKAGSGLHIHMRIMKDGQNQMLKDGVLSETARKAIAGMMELAPSITAFGNTNPTSYFRLVPHQEAPTNICWGDRNCSVLVRVPLGWSAKTDMCMLANPLEAPSHYDTTQKQTVEMRSPDGSADLYQLIAGLAVACRHGFEIENALEIAEKTYVNVNIHKKENEDRLKQLAQLLIAVPLLPIAWKNSVLFSNSIMYLVLQWSMELSVNCVPMKIVLYVVKYVTIRRKC